MNSVTPGPRILVVDDNDDNRYTLTLYLELEGYADIQIAEDGEQAIGGWTRNVSTSSCST